MSLSVLVSNRVNKNLIMLSFNFKKLGCNNPPRGNPCYKKSPGNPRVNRVKMYILTELIDLHAKIKSK